MAEKNINPVQSNTENEEIKRLQAELEKVNKEKEELNKKNENLEKEIEKNKEESKKNVKANTKEKNYIVCTPVSNFNGTVAGVQFAYGKAEVKEGWVLEWFKEKGYKVEEKIK